MVTILVVDDEPQVRRLLRAVLGQGGYEVVTATDGQEALDILARQSCDMLITDCDMSGMGGLELAERVRADQPTLPILVISGEMSDERRQVIKATGCLSLAKPFRPLSLLALVKEILS